MAMSKAQRVRNMLDKGASPQEIAKKLKISPQAVYNIRYQHNKKNGLGSLRPRAETKKPIVGPEKQRSVEPVEQPVPAKLDENETNPMWWLIIIAFAATLVAIVVS